VLAELYPQCFTAEKWQPHRPLKIGVHLDLIARGVLLPDECHALFLRYCFRLMYQRALAAGGPRFDLGGNVAGEVTQDQIEHALATVAHLEAKAIAKAEALRKQKAARKAARERATQQDDASLNPRKMGISKALSVENKPDRPDCQPAPRTPPPTPPPPAPPPDNTTPRRLGISDLKRAAVERRNGGAS
jgi:sRNA-binding protein